jgi:hypothetical protein
MNSNEYMLTDAERRHVSEVSAQLENFTAENLKLEGSIRRNEQEQSMMRRHLSLYLGQLAAVHGLPMGARLSADHARLIAPAGAAGHAETMPAAAPADTES